VNRKLLKPRVLEPGCRIAVISPASPAEPFGLRRGCDELRRLGYLPHHRDFSGKQGSDFAAELADRSAELLTGVGDDSVGAIVCARGGYGSNYLMDALDPRGLRTPKILLGYSDITTLHAFLWQRLGWVTFYGPMVAAGFDAGADCPGGYDSNSFTQAVTQTGAGWMLDLHAESLVAGEATGTLLGGCLTLVEATLGTPWEIQTQDSILILEDRAMKPYQVDRSLLHLKHAGMFSGVRGIILGEFPECESPLEPGPTVREVCSRILGPLQIPIVWGTPVGHTKRPMLTIPLGVQARLRAFGSGQVEILEPAVCPPSRQ
jgi:muramoyltetrapeptide carboxypeptidase